MEGIIAFGDSIADEGGCPARAVPRQECEGAEKEGRGEGEPPLTTRRPRHQRSLWHPSAEPAVISQRLEPWPR